MEAARIGIIGGSGLYSLDLLENVRSLALRTPFGDPSGEYRLGDHAGRRVAFLARHGDGHRLLPGEINYRANLYGFRMLGVETILGVSAVGSLREEIAPGDLVLPDQFLDRTRRQPSTFFGDGIAVHVAFAEPVCARARGSLADAAAAEGATVHDRGTYLCIEGPQFSTRAESLLYRSWGAAVIGMTNLPEAKLAREAEICYASLALVTDYDTWHDREESVTAGSVVELLRRNVNRARGVLFRTLSDLSPEPGCPCRHALRDSILTDPSRIDPAVRERLHLLIGRYLET
ncbi:MAG: S-methyl-5'-thioadenosine phosphorylase [Acidobacteria bacterium]|nr:S-methyl-5'-thioadenosine phosphorylase [Acidobacteriota bacterium]